MRIALTLTAAAFAQASFLSTQFFSDGCDPLSSVGNVHVSLNETCTPHPSGGYHVQQCISIDGQLQMVTSIFGDPGCSQNLYENRTLYMNRCVTDTLHYRSTHIFMTCQNTTDPVPPPNHDRGAVRESNVTGVICQESFVNEEKTCHGNATVDECLTLGHCHRENDNSNTYVRSYCHESTGYIVTEFFADNVCAYPLGAMRHNMNECLERAWTPSKEDGEHFARIRFRARCYPLGHVPPAIAPRVYTPSRHVVDPADLMPRAAPATVPEPAPVARDGLMCIDYTVASSNASMCGSGDHMNTSCVETPSCVRMPGSGELYVVARCVNGTAIETFEYAANDPTCTREPVRVEISHLSCNPGAFSDASEYCIVNGTNPTAVHTDATTVKMSSFSLSDVADAVAAANMAAADAVKAATGAAVRAPTAIFTQVDGATNLLAPRATAAEELARAQAIFARVRKTIDEAAAKATKATAAREARATVLGLLGGHRGGSAVRTTAADGLSGALAGGDQLGLGRDAAAAGAERYVCIFRVSGCNDPNATRDHYYCSQLDVCSTDSDDNPTMSYHFTCNNDTYTTSMFMSSANCSGEAFEDSFPTETCVPNTEEDGTEYGLYFSCVDGPEPAPPAQVVPVYVPFDPPAPVPVIPPPEFSVCGYVHADENCTASERYAVGCRNSQTACKYSAPRGRWWRENCTEGGELQYLYFKDEGCVSIDSILHRKRDDCFAGSINGLGGRSLNTWCGEWSPTIPNV